MATIIDALVVTLGLDGSSFKKGSDQSKKQLKDLKGDGAATAKDLEARGKQAAKFFSSIKLEALSLLAVLTAGAGLKNFATDQIANSAATARLAQNLNMSTEALSAWQGAAARSGGNAEAMASTLRGVSTELSKFKMGLSSDFVSWFARAGGDFTKLKDANSTVMELSRIISDLDKKDPGKALLVAKNLGVDEATFNFLRQGPKYVQDQLEAQQRLGVVTSEDGKRAIALQARLEALRQSSEKLGRDILTKLAPALEVVTEKLSDLAVFAQDHGPAVAAFFTVLAVAVAVPLAEVLAISAALLAVAVAVGYVYEQWSKWIDGSESDLAGFFQFFADGWKVVQQIFGSTFGAIGDLFSAWLASTKAALKFIYALFFGTGDDIRTAWAGLFDSLGGVWDKLLNLFTKGAPAVLDIIKRSFGAALEWVEGRITAVWDAITNKKKPASAATATPAPAPVPTVSQPATTPAKQSPRGIRNNNPGNLNYAGQEGSEKEGGPGGRFAVFTSMEQGISAMVTQLKLYQSRGVDTIEKIISKYAPSSENDTAGYIKALSQSTGKDANEKLNLDDFKQLLPLLKGIISHENGKGYVDDTQILAGARLATGRRAGSSTSTSTTDVKIGQMTIQTQATDAQGIARAAQAAFRDYPMIVPQANTGVQ